jgi:hypothetical protein
VTHALRRTLLGLALLLAASACGGGDDGCAGFISINATPEQCAALSAQYGCASFEVDGPSCGLNACATCTDL